MKFQTLVCTGIALLSLKPGFSQNRIDVLYDTSGNRISKKVTGNMPNFIVEAFIKEVWVGQPANLFAGNCINGNITWSNGITGGENSPISVAPNTTSNFSATCITAGCPNIPLKGIITVSVKRCVENGVLTNNSYDNFYVGNVMVQVAKKIDATNRISGGTISYEAGQLIEFVPGFEVKSGANFKAIIQGCPAN